MKRTSGRKEIESFLRFLIEGIPKIEPSDHFATRASRIVRSEPIEFSMVLQSMARKLVPVFMSLAILACAATYMLTSNGTATEFEAELLFENQEVEEEITVEYVLDNLGPLPGGKKR